MLWMPLTLILKRRFMPMQPTVTDRVAGAGAGRPLERTHGKGTVRRSPSDDYSLALVTAASSAVAPASSGTGERKESM